MNYVNNKARADQILITSSTGVETIFTGGAANNHNGADVAHGTPMSDVFSGWDTTVWYIPAVGLYNQGELPMLRAIPQSPAPKLPGVAVIYTVRFNGNGNDGGSMSDQEHMQGIPIALTSNAFTRTGHAFAGWDTNPAGATVVYHNHDIVTSLSDTQDAIVDLYAVWLAGGYNVYFNENGGSGGTESVAATFGMPMPDAVMPVRDGYIFGGYYDSEGIQYYDRYGNSARNFDKDSDITLYARWLSGATVQGYNDTPPDEWTVTYSGGRVETDSNEPEVNVEARIVDGAAAIYKIDIEWGSMTFVYDPNDKWNTDTLSYETGTPAGWLPGYFTNGNNQITAWNHSNADVKVSFNVTQKFIAGVDFEVNTVNALDATGDTAAVGIPLVKVPFEYAAAPSIDAYLRLDKAPDNLSALSDTAYTRIAIITVTIEPNPDNGLTPRS